MESNNNSSLAIPLAPLGEDIIAREMGKLKPLCDSLTRLQKVLRPGRRLDRLKREFRYTWLVEHEYTNGKCVDKVIFRDKELPPEMPQPAMTPIRRACRDLSKKSNRQLIRAAGGVVGS